MQVEAEKSKKAGMEQAEDVDKSKFEVLYDVRATLDGLFGYGANTRRRTRQCAGEREASLRTRSRAAADATLLILSPRTEIFSHEGVAAKEFSS